MRESTREKIHLSIDATATLREEASMFLGYNVKGRYLDAFMDVAHDEDITTKIIAYMLAGAPNHAMDCLSAFVEKNRGWLEEKKFNHVMEADRDN